MPDDVGARRRAVVVAGHRGDPDVARRGLADPHPSVRVVALGALARCGVLTTEELSAALADDSASVRRRAAELAATRDDVSLLPVFADPDPMVVEAAAWASGERNPPEPGAVAALSALAVDAADPLCREAAVAALGAIGDPAGLPAVLHGCTDRPNVRRRAVLALAPFDGPEVLAALERARTDRDWQVRQAAEDLLEIVRGHRGGPAGRAPDDPAARQ
ncbi:MAG TPA: HEAT repeat domain-containing protein [Acidimicrobiales bacterium]